MHIYICEDQPENILTGIYNAWASPVPNKEIRLIVNEPKQQELFCIYHSVETDAVKFRKTADSITRKLGSTIWEDIRLALMSDQEDKAQAVFSYLRLAFAVGPGIRQQLGKPEVMRIYELTRMVSRECEHLKGFVRFADTKEGILVAQFEPKHRQVPLLAPHFAERLNTERFILYDSRRKEAAVHSPDFGWYLTLGEAYGMEERIRESERDGYASLWDEYVRCIAIEQRKNPRCQRNLLPLRFRPYMTEFRRKNA